MYRDNRKRTVPKNRRRWTREEDELLLRLPAPVAAKLIGVAEQTAANRRKRLGRSTHRIFER